MTKLFASLAAATCLLCLIGSVQAGTYSFSPNPNDLWDLDHYKYYRWGISWSLPADEYITCASLFIDNINNWKVEPNILYINLLDDLQVGTTQSTDNQGGGNNFAGQGILLTTYTDTGTGTNPPEDWTYNFTPAQIQTLTQYLSNGIFGLGFDPDCHYYNDGIYLRICTQIIPEPMSLVTLLTGAAGLVVARRRK